MPVADIRTPEAGGFFAVLTRRSRAGFWTALAGFAAKIPLIPIPC